VANENQLDYGRVILYFLCLYFRKIQKEYLEDQYNSWLMVFKDQCNEVISGRSANCNLKLGQLELNFQRQASGFRLGMKFADMGQAEAYWQQVIEGLRGFSPLDALEFLDKDPNSKLFLFVLLFSQSQSHHQDGLISLDLPSHGAFLSEVMRWLQPLQPQTQ